MREQTVPENGFLGAQEAPIFHANLYIAAMGRSGSTALANMLTTPPTRWVLTEPWFINGATSKTFRDRWTEFGWIDRDHDWWIPPSERKHEIFVRRYREFLAPRLSTLEAWGVKEVRGDFHVPTISTINPKYIVVLVRDIRDVIRSLLEKQIRQGSEATHGRGWIEQYISGAAQSLVAISASYGARARVVRFEEIMADPAAQRSLSEWLDWPLDGDPFAGLADYGRGYEVKRRIEGEPRVLPPDAAAIIDDIAATDAATEYQMCFGYLPGK